MKRSVVAKVERRVQKMDPESLERIQNTLFTVCLDEKTTASTARQRAAWARLDNGNRNFHAGIQLFVAGDGAGAVNVEHAVGDGAAAMKISSWIAVKAETIQLDKNAEKGLDWQSVSDMSLDERLIKSESSAEPDNYRVELITFDAREALALTRKLKISPDVLVQVAVNRAYEDIAGEKGNVYEPIDTRIQEKGRITVISTAMNSSLRDFVQTSLLHKNPTEGVKIKLLQLLRGATTQHQKMVAEAKAGKDTFSRLYALTQVARGPRFAGAGILYQSVSISSVAPFGFNQTFFPDVVASNGGDVPGVESFGSVPSTSEGVACGYYYTGDGQIVMTVIAGSKSKHTASDIEKGVVESLRYCSNIIGSYPSENILAESRGKSSS